MEDHHVDRPGVEAQQCVKLTGTNRSIGLIVLINQCSLFKVGVQGLCPLAPRRLRAAMALVVALLLQGATLILRIRPDTPFDLRLPGGYGGVPTPDPIPNSAVKSSSADGTAS